MMDLKLSGHTQPFAVLGHPIGHTLSPAMHNASIQALGMDGIYLAFDVHPDRLMTVLPAMRDMGFGGVNLTVPLKEVAFRGLRDLDASARRLGAVNTVEFLKDGELRGHNTDGAGFVKAVREEFGEGISGKRVFVLGSGGAGRAVALQCAAEGATEIAVTDLEGSRAERLGAELGREFPACRTGCVPPGDEAWKRAAITADLVIQCTPVGMKREDAPLLGQSSFRAGQMLFDLVYMYPETAIMREARAAGARAANGLLMLLYQGATAFTIWTGRQPVVAEMRRALETAVYGAQR